MSMILFLLAQITQPTPPVTGSIAGGRASGPLYTDGQVLPPQMTYACDLTNADRQNGRLVISLPNRIVRAVGPPIELAADPKRYLPQNIRFELSSPQIHEDDLKIFDGYLIKDFTNFARYSKFEMTKPEDVRRDGNKLIRTFATSLRVEFIPAESGGKQTKLSVQIRRNGTAVVAAGYCVSRSRLELSK